MRDLNEQVTDRILAELTAGVVPWVRSWSETPGINISCNATAGRQYSGVNVVLLWLAYAKGWSPLKQALDAGGHVRMGEHGQPIYFVKEMTFKDADDKRHVRMLTRYTVFNISQCEDLPEKITRPPAPRHNDARDLTVDEFLAAIGADIRQGSDRAVYNSKDDYILIPPFGVFSSAAAYYATVFHEVVHWTGHRLRLNRDLGGRFSIPEQRYAAEELIAELGSAFLAAEFSIDGRTTHASYISSWISLLKDDPRAFFTCVSKAQTAIDFLRELALREPVQTAAAE